MASRPPEGPMDPTPPTDLERQRWFVLNAMRIFGFGLAIAGILMTQGILDIAGDSNRVVGYAFIVVGLLDGFAMPQVLARKWRTPPQ
jgi:hypothetical protein